MARINKQRLTAEIEGDFVVFIIGMRINKLWKVWKWFPVFLAMPKMIAELKANPESGLLGANAYLGGPRSPAFVQYWRSFEHLERYARDRDATHWPAWVAFNKKIASNGDVGIWHETYLVPAGQYETVYNNLPTHGLGAATQLVTATQRRQTAAGRLGRLGREDDAPAQEVSAAPVEA